MRITFLYYRSSVFEIPVTGDGEYLHFVTLKSLDNCDYAGSS